jgi:uncharacterized protein YfaS (alpha-2-macroglobulin family)
MALGVKFVATDGTAELWDEVEGRSKCAIPRADPSRSNWSSRSRHSEQLRNNDPQIIEGTGELTVNLPITRIVELRESLRPWLEYPYGCVQSTTTSSLLPWSERARSAAKPPGVAKPDEEIESAVNAGIRLLMSMQTSGGGLSYWHAGREPMLWGSAYASIALTRAQQQGFAVPDAEYNGCSSTSAISCAARRRISPVTA